MGNAYEERAKFAVEEATKRKKEAERTKEIHDTFATAKDRFRQLEERWAMSYEDYENNLRALQVLRNEALKTSRTRALVQEASRIERKFLHQDILASKKREAPATSKKEAPRSKKQKTPSIEKKQISNKEMVRISKLSKGQLKKELKNLWWMATNYGVIKNNKKYTALVQRTTELFNSITPYKSGNFVDGAYGPNTMRAVKKLQENTLGYTADHKNPRKRADGKAGRQTIADLINKLGYGW